MNSFAPARLEPLYADRWLAVLRIVVGLWFLKSVRTKLGGFLAFGFLPLPSASERWIGFMPTRLLEYAETVRIGVFHDFLVNVVVAQPLLFGNLTAFGEAAVGLGLTLGLLTRPAAAIGALVMVNYLFATFWVGFCQQGFHLLLFTGMVAFLASGAGRTWGLDRWLAERYPHLFLVRWRWI
ncbi:MAG: TQO small subunit DoxD [Gemmatimonadota bacterium]